MLTPYAGFLKPIEKINHGFRVALSSIASSTAVTLRLGIRYVLATMPE